MSDYKSKFYKQKKLLKKLQNDLHKKDLIIDQYKILYNESRSALKIAKKAIKTNGDELDNI